MKLTIVTPLSVVVDAADAAAIRAEDASGSFGILPGHAAFLTALSVSVVGWRALDGAEHYCAVRRGTLSVSGADVMIASREAVPGDDLQALERTVLDRFTADLDAERAEHSEGARVQLAAIRKIVERLHAYRRGGA